MMSPETRRATSSHEIEALLERLRQGDKTAMDTLLPLLFEDLRRLARSQRNRLGGGETLCTTALVHEAYLKLRDSTRIPAESQRHFLHTAALAMRQILIDHARSQLASLDRAKLIWVRDQDKPDQTQKQARLVLDIDRALHELEASHPRLVNVVNYRYFAGYSEAEIADLLEISVRTVRRDWFRAKAWLADKLNAHDIRQSPSI